MNASQPARDPEAERLDARLRDWMITAPAGFTDAGRSLGARYGLDAVAATRLDREFDALAIELFEYQSERVDVYRAFVAASGRAAPRCAVDVPPLPLAAFKQARVAAFPPERERVAFHTSGTTNDRPGRLGLDDLSLYDLSLARGFRHHVLPDLDRIRMLLVVGTALEMPHSSLAYMLDHVRRLWGAAGSGHFVRDGRVQYAAFAAAVRGACHDREPVCLMGTAFAWVHVLDTCRAEGFRVVLPGGSRLFETGGYKGRSRELSRLDLLAGFEQHFGIPATHVVSEYGMTEMASQFYTTSLRAALLGTPLDQAVWSHPAWLRPHWLDPEPGKLVELADASGVGLLAHHDLANRGSVAHLLTADLGLARDAGFELAGRCPQADPRGCGLVYEILPAVRKP